LKSALSKDCDEILNKIDDLLSTEITTFDKAQDYRMKESVEGSEHSTDEQLTYYEQE